MQVLKFSIFSPTTLLRYSFSKVRKAKTYIPKKYQALPPWTVIKQNDPFDYKLRSIDDLRKEQAENPPNFSIGIIYNDYPRATYEEVADKSRKAIIELNMLEMSLTKLQKERLIKLIGTRYKGSDVFRLTCESYATFEENFTKVMEMLREIYWEAKRAP